MELKKRGCPSYFFCLGDKNTLTKSNLGASPRLHFGEEVMSAGT